MKLCQHDQQQYILLLHYRNARSGFVARRPSRSEKEKINSLNITECDVTIDGFDFIVHNANEYIMLSFEKNADRVKQLFSLLKLN